MIFKTLLLAAGGIPLITGLISTLFFGRVNRHISVPGLLFHSVNPGSIQPNLSCISVKRFCAIIDTVKNSGFQAVTLSSLSDTDKKTESKKVLLTFDDGFQNIADNAISVLDDAGFKANIFCVSDFIGNTSSWDVYKGSRHMNKDTIRRISDAGHEIGSHSSTHANLTYLSDSDLVKELNTSRSKLEDITGKAVTSLSFPFGSWNKRIWKFAREAGYKTATVYRNHNCSFDADLYPVYGVYQFDTPATILDKINPQSSFSIVKATAVILSHFSKGTPVWQYRPEYTHLPY